MWGSSAASSHPHHHTSWSWPQKKKLENLGKLTLLLLSLCISTMQHWLERKESSQSAKHDAGYVSWTCRWPRQLTMRVFACNHVIWTYPTAEELANLPTRNALCTLGLEQMATRSMRSPLFHDEPPPGGDSLLYLFFSDKPLLVRFPFSPGPAPVWPCNCVAQPISRPVEESHIMQECDLDAISAACCTTSDFSLACLCNVQIPPQENKKHDALQKNKFPKTFYRVV